MFYHLSLDKPAERINLSSVMSQLMWLPLGAPFKKRFPHSGKREVIVINDLET